GQPADRQGGPARGRDPSRCAIRRRRDAGRTVEPAFGASARLRPHAPPPRGLGAPLRVHPARHAARAGDGRRAGAVPPGREGGVRGALGPYKARGGARGPQADHRRSGRRCRRGDVARGVQAVPPVLLRRSVLRRQPLRRTDALKPRSDRAMHAPPRVLFVTRYYWPELIGSAPFSTDIAEWLTDHDHQTTVVSGLPHYPDAAVFPAYREGRRRRETVCGVDV